MELIEKILEKSLENYIHSTYSNADLNKFIFQPTNKDHAGDITLMVFPLAKTLKVNPDALAEELGRMLSNIEYIESYVVIKGFLNLTYSAFAWKLLFDKIEHIGYKTETKQKIVLEYCGPNTNKPLHIGHLRNMFLGYSVGNILSEVGHDVHKVTIYNDRGIAICKSMIAYQLYGNKETPEQAGLKGDFLIGKYYVLYNTILVKEVAEAIEQGLTKEEAELRAPIALAAQKMLEEWEEGNSEVLALWNQMNTWFYQGIRVTYNLLEIDFEKEYFESLEYKNGKQIVETGYKKGIFQKDENGGIYIDLSEQGLDKKYLQRSNGTSIYITQDMALIKRRYEDFQMDKIIYTVGDEQNYHFKVLGHIMDALKEPYSSKIFHLSYGLVTSKDGSKFKSREGTTADADTIVHEVIEEAKNQTLESGKGDQLERSYLDELSKIIGIGALKFAMLKINPKKSIPFDPKEAVDMHGDTGTFIQYSYVRTRAILSKNEGKALKPDLTKYELNQEEKNILSLLYTYPDYLKKAEEKYDPSEIAHFALQLAKTFNRFYTQHSILKAENEHIATTRLYLVQLCSIYLKKSLYLLGIKAPEKM